VDYSLVLRQDLTELFFNNMCTCQTLRGEDVKDVVRERSESVPVEREVSEPLHEVGYAATLTAETAPLSLAKVKIYVTSSIYGNRSYESTVWWGPVNGTSAGKRRNLYPGSLHSLFVPNNHSSTFTAAS